MELPKSTCLLGRGKYTPVEGACQERAKVSKFGLNTAFSTGYPHQRGTVWAWPHLDGPSFR